MSKVVKSVFGGTDDSAQKAQIAANAQSQAFIAEKAAEARGDVIPLFGSGQQAVQQGFQGALDVLGQTIPQQLQAFQGGNVGAQNALLGGQPNFRAALLGLPQAAPQQAQTLQFDPSFAQQTLPAFQTPQQVLNPQQQQQPNFLSGLNFNFGGF